MEQPTHIGRMDDIRLKDAVNPSIAAIQAQNVSEPNSNRSSVHGAPLAASSKAKPKHLHAYKKETGLLRMIGAPHLDVQEAKRQILIENQAVIDDCKASEMPMKELEAAEFPPLEKCNQHDAEYLDASSEETFTLETFYSLLEAARMSEKSFILARVTTVDPSDLTRLYYSYYAAHHINKVLFRTQPSEGLLHRMKSRNPLNNMLIVGDVHYFSISPEEFDECCAKHEEEYMKSQVCRSSINNNHSNTSLLVTSDSSDDSSSTHSTDTPLIYEATFFATDDDFLMKGKVRDFFKKNSVGVDDYQLFQLNRRSDLPYSNMTVLGPDGNPLVTNQSRESNPATWRNLGGILDSGSHTNLAGCNSGFLSPLGFWIGMIALTSLVVFLSLAFLPDPYYYFVFIGLVATFGITLILFVNWTD